jgi:hypothetical protein
MPAGPLQSFRPRARNLAKHWTPERPMFCRTFDGWIGPRRRTRIPSRKPVADGCQAPSFAALLKAHVFIRCSTCVVVDRCFPLQPKGPARALIGSLRHARSVMDLRDGLPTLIRLRLPSLSAGPYAMEVGVVFAGWPSATIVPNLLKSVGRDRPQYPVRKSTCFSCGDVVAVLAMLADDEAA